MIKLNVVGSTNDNIMICGRSNPSLGCVLPSDTTNLAGDSDPLCKNKVEC